MALAITEPCPPRQLQLNRIAVVTCVAAGLLSRGRTVIVTFVPFVHVVGTAARTEIDTERSFVRNRMLITLLE